MILALACIGLTTWNLHFDLLLRVVTVLDTGVRIKLT